MTDNTYPGQDLIESIERKPRETSEFNTETAQQDAVFGILADSRRRFSLQHLRGADTPVKVSELTEEIEAWEDRGSSGGGADSIEIALVHNHLPKMAAAGLVEYDADRGTVAPAKSPPELGRISR